MVIDGADYSLPLIAVLSFLVMLVLQLLLLRTVRLRFLRHLPWVWVIGVLILAVATLFGETGGWLDLRSFFCMVLCGYAAICGSGIGLAYLLHKLMYR